MNIGGMDRYIAIQTPTWTQNAFGESTKAYATLANVWARIQYNKGKENFEGDKLTAVHNVIFTIRFLEGFDETAQISYNSRTYKIENIQELGRNEGLKLITTYKD